MEREITRQVLRPDLRLEIPAETQEPESRLADIKKIGLGGKSWYKTGFSGGEDEVRAVDRRAKRVQGEYNLKAKKMDVFMGEEEGRGPDLGGWASLGR